MEWSQNQFFCDNLPTIAKPSVGKILVTGATGYIGGRLVPELLARGYDVRVMVRVNSPELKEKWPAAQIVAADVFDYNSLTNALEGIHTAYYLIHSLLFGKDKFEKADMEAAINFREAAEKCKAKKIIYLGGLGDFESALSPHLRSRIRVAQEIRKGKVASTILRAAVIIGSGSASYEIVKHLIKNIPFLLIPPWARTKCQPISIRDVIMYLVGVLETDGTEGKIYDIGGRDVLSYEKMLKIQSDIMGKKRFFLHFPLNMRAIYAYLVSLATPVPVPITLNLMASSMIDVVCQNDDIRNILPIDTLSYKASLLRALSREEQDEVYTRWSDAYPPALKLHELKKSPFTFKYSLFTDKRPSGLYNTICKIGGDEGWYYFNWMWRIRGAIDRMFLGVGSSRGRKKISGLQINDVIDFWRVEDIKMNELLLLRAEMKIPGKMWLQFSINKKDSSNYLSIKAFFYTSTITGLFYWYFFLPFHYFVIMNLVKQIDKRS